MKSIHMCNAVCQCVTRHNVIRQSVIRQDVMPVGLHYGYGDGSIIYAKVRGRRSMVYGHDSVLRFGCGDACIYAIRMHGMVRRKRRNIWPEHRA